MELSNLKLSNPMRTTITKYEKYEKLWSKDTNGELITNTKYV